MDLRLDLLHDVRKQSWVFLATGAPCRKKFLPHIPIMHQSNMMSYLSNVSERLL